MQCVDLGGRRIIKKNFFKQKTAYEISECLVGSEMCIRDSGTSFGVSAYPGYPNYTTLVRGSVRFTSLRQEQVVLTPGEQAVVNISGTLEKRNVDVEEFVGWKDGVFIFKDKTLAEIMQILERWYGVNVIFQDESLKELEYTGSLERYDSINTFLQLLEKLKEIRYEIKKNTIVLFK